MSPGAGRWMNGSGKSASRIDRGTVTGEGWGLSESSYPPGDGELSEGPKGHQGLKGRQPIRNLRFDNFWILTSVIGQSTGGGHRQGTKRNFWDRRLNAHRQTQTNTDTHGRRQKSYDHKVIESPSRKENAAASVSVCVGLCLSVWFSCRRLRSPVD